MRFFRSLFAFYLLLTIPNSNEVHINKEILNFRDPIENYDGKLKHIGFALTK